MRNPDGIEYKSNPWHDPENGRFTCAGTGHYNGRGGGGSAGSSGTDDGSGRSSRSGAAPNRVPPLRKPAPGMSRPAERHRRPWRASGCLRPDRRLEEAPAVAGALAARERRERGVWQSRDVVQLLRTVRRRSLRLRGMRRKPLEHPRGRRTRPASSFARWFATVMNTGSIHASETRRVSGILSIADVPVRLQTSQAQGGPRRTSGERRRRSLYRGAFQRSDRGIQLFAQDANFNRGRYRVLGDEWAREACR